MHDEHSRFSSGSSNRLDGLFKKREGLATIISLAHSSPTFLYQHPKSCPRFC